MFIDVTFDILYDSFETLFSRLNSFDGTISCSQTLSSTDVVFFERFSSRLSLLDDVDLRSLTWLRFDALERFFLRRAGGGLNNRLVSFICGGEVTKRMGYVVSRSEDVKCAYFSFLR